MGFISCNRPRVKSRNPRARKRIKLDIQEERPSVQEKPGLTFETLPLELIQHIFILSGEFSLPLCSQRLYHGLCHSNVLVRLMALEHSIEVKKDNEWMVLAMNVDFLSRRFVDSDLLLRNGIRAFYSDSCEISMEEEVVNENQENDENQNEDQNQNQNQNESQENDDNENENENEDQLMDGNEANDQTNQENVPPLTRDELFQNYNNNVTNKPHIPDYLEPAIHPDMNDRQFNLTVYLLTANCVSRYPKSVIEEACKRNNLEAVKALIDRGLELDHNALISSFMNENIELLEYLLSLNKIDLNDTELWEYVASTKNIDLFTFLRGFGANPPYHVLSKLV